MRNQVISLYDYTGEALRPWADAGYECHAYDIQHEGEKTIDGITYWKADLHSAMVLETIINKHKHKAVFMSAFPVCTDLAVSGAAHFANKERENPGFQQEAAHHAMLCGYVGMELGCPFYIENPVSRLASIWRKPDYYFHPYEYGGYLAPDDIHPRWPEYIAPRDAYSKKTCLWTGNGFIMPDKREVMCHSYGSSTQHRKLGGKSMKTKNIRSATPRGFAQAVMEANQ
jgi:hypothetical protein